MNLREAIDRPFGLPPPLEHASSTEIQDPQMFRAQQLFYQATSEIQILVGTLLNEKFLHASIINSLSEAVRRGVSVRLLLNKYSINPEQQIDALKRAGIVVYLIGKPLKFVNSVGVIDGRGVATENDGLLRIWPNHPAFAKRLKAEFMGLLNLG